MSDDVTRLLERADAIEAEALAGKWLVGRTTHAPHYDDCLTCEPVRIAAALAARLRDAEAENARLQTIAHRLAQCWMYGGWKADTKNERDIEAAMRAIGWWPIPGETLIERENWVAARAQEARDGTR
jgi:hypothetical protein